jgi:very-short-patch-repair endonuclease
MIIKIVACDPAGIGDDIQRTIEESVSDVQGLTETELADLRIRRQSLAWETLEEFISDEDTIVVEIDTVAGTARVVPVTER